MDPQAQATNLSPLEEAQNKAAPPVRPKPPGWAAWLWFFLKDNWLLVLAIAYLIFPIDVIPDIVPIAGLGDDATLIALELGRRWWTSKKEHKA